DPLRYQCVPEHLVLVSVSAKVSPTTHYPRLTSPRLNTIYKPVLFINRSCRFGRSERKSCPASGRAFSQKNDSPVSLRVVDEGGGGLLMGTIDRYW
ncbi:MAG: hypothetical protein MUC43_13035, partial [Pirellula sp.]|nr:hypothetical protein [Pirellula sp.]